eukprot:1158310-Pelagomonas_calceolata.AAC.16
MQHASRDAICKDDATCKMMQHASRDAICKDDATCKMMQHASRDAATCNSCAHSRGNGIRSIWPGT